MIKKVFSMGLLVMLPAFAVVFSGCDPDAGGGFVAVTHITEVPAVAAEGLPLALTGTVVPADATNKTIVWSLKDAGTTGAEITENNVFTATMLGHATVTATIVGGVAEGTPFTKDFPITVDDFVAVEGFVGGDMVVAELGELFALNDRDRAWWAWPTNASDRTIIWSVKNPGTTGATITGNNLFTATALGDATVTGTVANGKEVGVPFSADRTVRVKGPLVAHGDFVIRDILGSKELVQYLGTESSVVIPDNLGITIVGGFWGSTTITTITVPEGVTEVGFGEVFGLTSVTLPQSLRILNISICPSLTSLTIPSGVTRVNAFMDCRSLTSMTVQAETPPVVEKDWRDWPGGDLFPGDLIPEDFAITIYVPSSSVDAYKNADTWKDYADLIQPISQ